MWRAATKRKIFVELKKMAVCWPEGYAQPIVITDADYWWLISSQHMVTKLSRSCLRVPELPQSLNIVLKVSESSLKACLKLSQSCLKLYQSCLKLPKVVSKLFQIYPSCPKLWPKLWTPGGDTSQVHFPISYSQLGNLTYSKLVQTLEGLFISHYSVDPRLSCNLKKLVKLES